MKQYIGFHLNESEYTLPILKVKEIITMPEITKVPQTLPYIEGITNLRGSIIPIVNLKRLVRLGNEESAGTKVVVVASGNVSFGILVDGITGVISIDESSIEPPEKFLNNGAEQIEGVAKLKDRLVVMLDTKKLIPVEDLGMFEDVVVDVKDVGSDKVEVVKKVQTIAGEVQVKEIRDAKDFFAKRNIDPSDPRYMIFDDLMEFIDAMTAGDYEKADHAIQGIMKKGQSELFQEIGKVTRKLHDSIASFKEAVDTKLKDMAHVEMPNAIDRLNLVMQKTEEAAHRTITIVEKHLLSLDEFSDKVRVLQGPDDSIAYLKSFRNRLEDDLTDLITTQSFQDITGQTIKKVIKLVGELEEELIRLISTFGVKIESGGLDERRVQEIVSQSGVDDLLKEFGF